MKGPGLRSNFAGMRCWRCPQTGHQLHTPANVTSLASPFANGKWMHPVDPIRKYREPVPIEQFVSVVEAEPEPEPAPELPAKTIVEQIVVTEIIEQITIETEIIEEPEEESFGDGLE